MPTRRAKLRRHVYALLPKWIKRNDFELFAAVISILAGIPILLGQVRPSSPEELLPTPIVLAWGFVLTFGGIAIILGVVISNRLRYPEKVFWMRIQALGLTGLAYFCYLYSLCVIVVAYDSGWPGGLIILAFGLISHVREVAIQMELEGYRLSLGLMEKA